MRHDLEQILGKYSLGKADAETTNQALEDLGSGLRIDPEKNELTEEEKLATTVGYYPSQTNGWGLLDTGTGSLDKVEVRQGRLVHGGVGEMFALCLVAGRLFHVQGDALRS